MNWIRELLRFGAPRLNDMDAAKLARKHELAGRIEACRSRWESAEDAARRTLELDPEDRGTRELLDGILALKSPG